MGALKHVGLIGWCAGIAACIGLTAWFGFGDVAHAIASVGWGMLLVVLTRITTVSIAGAGWWILFPTRERLQLWYIVMLRFVREAVNTLVPLTQIGGDVIGARLLTFRNVPSPLAAASVIIDVLLQAVTQFAFATVGLLTLLALGVDTTVAFTAAAGLALAAPLLGGFYVMQRRGAHRIIRAILTRVTGDDTWRGLGTFDAVYGSLSRIYARRSQLLTSTVVHLAGWVVGVAEVLVVFACMGHPVTVAEALVIESLLHAVRGAAFVIPSALGAQEAALILLCGIFGIPPDQALALSLIKRAADLVVGIPGLIALQVLEGGRLTTSYARRTGRVQVAGELQSEGS
jgi:putative membrane protein